MDFPSKLWNKYGTGVQKFQTKSKQKQNTTLKALIAKENCSSYASFHTPFWLFGNPTAWCGLVEYAHFMGIGGKVRGVCA